MFGDDPIRQIILVRGTSQEVVEQIEQLTEICRVHGRTVVSIAMDGPDKWGEMEGWKAANRMVVNWNEADRILIPSYEKVLPAYLETVADLECPLRRGRRG